MTQHQQQQPITERPFSSFFDSDVIAEWLAHHMKHIIYGLVAFLVLLASVYLLSNRSTKLSEKQYQEASQAFILFLKPTADTAQQAVALKTLQSLMAEHPDLQAAYGGTVAQTLINRGNVSGALPIAQATLHRTAANYLPFYQQYDETTLLIIQGKIQDALSKAQSLQMQIENEIKTLPSWNNRSFGPELFPLNLFRIGMLQQKIGDRAAEKATWKLWNQYAGMDDLTSPSLPIDSRTFRMVIQHLSVGTTTLPDYIKERLKEK